MSYPSRQEIVQVMQNFSVFNRDPSLSSGVPIKRNGRPVIFAGGYTLVFPITTQSRKYALRCWIASVGDGKYRYREIDKYLKQVNLPYFVDFSYVEEGIFIKEKNWDTIRMEWVDALKLKEYLSNKINYSDEIKELANQFFEMTRAMHSFEIAHGDLQHGNILVKQDGSLVLVDYDSLYVPTFGNTVPDLIKGLRGYQHSSRNNNKFSSKKLDYFSEAVIYLSLIVLAEAPDFWVKYRVDKSEDFLFTEQDFLNPNRSPVFQELLRMSPDIKNMASKLAIYCQAKSIEEFSPLDTFISATSKQIITEFRQKDSAKSNTERASNKIIRKLKDIMLPNKKTNNQSISKSIIDKMKKKK